jgi:Txe/YoeB family toxin of Txe-Axe toxin-antitoxin module
VNWRVLFTRQAQNDARKLASASPALKGACSRRINIQHRLVYEVLKEERVVKVLRLWSHYDE